MFKAAVNILSEHCVILKQLVFWQIKISVCVGLIIYIFSQTCVEQLDKGSKMIGRFRQGAA